MTIFANVQKRKKNLPPGHRLRKRENEEILAAGVNQSNLV